MTKTWLVSGLVIALGCSKSSDEKPSTNKPSGLATTASSSDGAGGSGGGSGSAGGNGGSAGSGSAGSDAQLVERGAYLAGLMGCGYCHMPMGPSGPDFSRVFAGGLEITEAFGTWRSPNITPHKGSGIGSWTDEQIIDAVREGVRPDGGQLYPIMPYLNYNRMTDADARALVAFLRSLPAIDNVVAPTRDLKMPKIPAPKPANAPDPIDDPLKHGEYLATLMHCNMCHTPMTKDGMPDMSRMFAGGFEMELPPLGTGKLYGSNLTSEPETGLGSWSLADVEKAIKTMTRPDGTIIQGPMQFYLAGWSKLEAKDLTAIATFIKAIPPIKNVVPKSTFKPHGPGGPNNPNAEGAQEGKAGARGPTGTADAMKEPARTKSSAQPKPAARGPVKKHEDPDAGGE